MYLFNENPSFGILKIAPLFLLVFSSVFGDEVILNGADEVFIVDIDTKTGEMSDKLWSWTANNAQGLPVGKQGQFRTTDESKPVYNGTKILITSSGSGVALVDRETKVVEFYATVGNAHSADILPNKRIGVAGSLGNDRFYVFDEENSDQPLFNVPCPGCHGVYWDEGRSLLYVLNYPSIKVYELENWESNNPSISEVDDIPIGGSGHDLMPIEGTPLLSVTGRGNWLVNRDTKEVNDHPDMNGIGNVKSLNHHPLTGQILYTRGTNGYGTYDLQFLNPDFTVDTQGEFIYKVRWNITVIKGCMDSSATNFDPGANVDDGSCTFTSVLKNKQVKKYYSLIFSNVNNEILISKPGKYEIKVYDIFGRIKPNK